MLTAIAAKRHDNGLAMPINEPLNILVLDDSGFDRLRIRREIFQSGITANIDEVSCLCQLGPALDEKRYQMVIIDYFLPDGTGEEALDILVGHDINKNATPIIVSGNSWLNEGSFKERANSVKFLQKGRLGYGNVLRDIVRAENFG